MRTTHGLDRFLTFIDAIVAIAVTLLILPLADAATEADGTEPLREFLDHQSSRIGVFLLSFVVIIAFWRAHHRVFERVAGYDSVVVWVTLVWALTIVLLPFPTQLVVAYPSTNRGVVGIYIGTLLLSSVCLTTLGTHIYRTPALHRDDLDPELAATPPLIVPTALMMVSLVLAVAVPAINYRALFLLFLSGPTNRLWLRYWRQRTVRPVGGAQPAELSGRDGDASHQA